MFEFFLSCHFHFLPYKMGACNSVHYVDDDDNFNWSSFFVNEYHKLGQKSRDFYADNQLVSLIVQRDGFKLMYVNPELLNNPNIIALALKQNGLALQFVPLNKRTKETVLLAVEQNGNALMFAPRELQDDVEVVLAAVAQNPTL